MVSNPKRSSTGPFHSRRRDCPSGAIYTTHCLTFLVTLYSFSTRASCRAFLSPWSIFGVAHSFAFVLPSLNLSSSGPTALDLVCMLRLLDALQSFLDPSHVFLSILPIPM